MNVQLVGREQLERAQIGRLPADFDPIFAPSWIIKCWPKLNKLRVTDDDDDVVAADDDDDTHIINRI